MTTLYTVNIYELVDCKWMFGSPLYEPTDFVTANALANAYNAGSIGRPAYLLAVAERVTEEEILRVSG